MGRMNSRARHILQALLAIVMAVGLVCCAPGEVIDTLSSSVEGQGQTTSQTSAPAPEPTPLDDGQARIDATSLAATVREDGTYTSKVEVALYIHTFGTVPSNYISKTKARNAGWESTKGNLDEVLPGKSIGGGGYSNESWYGEPLLPETQEGRFWHECDINYAGGYRGPERLVYSEDGLVFYTGDHYETFERLY